MKSKNKVLWFCFGNKVQWICCGCTSTNDTEHSGRPSGEITTEEVNEILDVVFFTVVENTPDRKDGKHLTWAGFKYPSWVWESYRQNLRHVC